MGRGHPECPQRLDAIDDYLLASGVDVALQRREAPLVDLADVVHAHASGYVAELRDVLEHMQDANIPLRSLDPDTAACPGTWRAVQRAAGAAVGREHGGNCRRTGSACPPHERRGRRQFARPRSRRSDQR